MEWDSRSLDYSSYGADHCNHSGGVNVLGLLRSTPHGLNWPPSPCLAFCNGNMGDIEVSRAC